MKRLNPIHHILLLCSCCFSFIHAGELIRHDGVKYIAHAANDGDSFMAEIDGRTHMLRLYFVDCPETTLGAETDRRRVREQARYFGIESAAPVIQFGKIAREHVADILKKKSFPVYSSFARAPGRSGKPRVYSMVELTGGIDLAEHLVRNGLARAHGVKRRRPDGTPGDEYYTYLQDLELAAALQGKGLWKYSLPDKLAELRKEQRDEERELEVYAFGAFSTLSSDDPIDLNNTSVEILQQLKGVGPVLANRIMKAAPYRKVTDLMDVDGIGPGLMEKITPFVTVK